MGVEVNWDDIPLSYNELSDRSRLIHDIFYMLQDKIDYFNGKYLGKDYTTLSLFYEVYGIEDKITVLQLLRSCEDTYRELVNDKTRVNETQNATESGKLPNSSKG